MNFADLSKEEQHDLVVSDSLGELPDEMSELLRGEENVRAWRTALVDAVTLAEAESTRRRHELDASWSRENEAIYDDWRSRHVYYQRNLEARLREAKDLIHQYAQTNYIAILKNERKTLIEAIVKHRDEFDDFDDPSEADEELWATLNDIGA